MREINHPTLIGDINIMKMIVCNYSLGLDTMVPGAPTLALCLGIMHMLCAS